MKTVIITLTNKVGLIAIAGLGLCCANAALAQDLAQDLAVATVGATMAVESQSQGQALAAQARALNKEQAQAQAVQPLPLPAAPGKEAAESPALQLPASGKPEGETPSKTVISDAVTAGSGIITSPPVLASGKGKIEKEESPLTSGKVPESVRGVVKRLNTATEDITLEDLNSAREAVAKLDILIDIEKRLSDLDTIRQERQEKGLGGAIPATALGMRGNELPLTPPPLPPQPFPTTIMPPISSMSSSVEIDRIQGAGGRYTAFVKEGEGKSTLVHEGDKLLDGSVVQAITSQGVTLLRDKKKKTLKVRDIGAVFGAR